MVIQTAMYLRSSKDRSDVSISAQRDELRELASSKGLVVVEEFVDAVESGKTENRPGFQSLITNLKSKDRDWNTLLMLDTSRLSRRQFISTFFEHEAQKNGVKIIYKSLPDSDPVTSTLLRGMLQAMDQWHSMVSKQKGLAGMAQNINQGYRAGGSAPRGYSLDKVETGTVRDGKPVTKSRLVVNSDSELIAEYLSERAKGLSRKIIYDRLKMPWSQNTLLSIEWNALTYAGNTVWNVHSERVDGASVSGKKRRPRSEWHVKEDTHQALITQQEAEKILSQLEESKYSKTRRTPAKYLLTGVLQSVTGERWHGDRRAYYRLNKGKRVSCKLVDNAFLTAVKKDFKSKRFLNKLMNQIQSLGDNTSKKIKTESLMREIDAKSAKMTRIVELMVSAESTRPLMRMLSELESSREKLIKEVKLREEEMAAVKELKKITEGEVSHLLNDLSVELEEKQGELLKDLILKIVDKVVLDDKNPTQLMIYYSIINRGVIMASPRGFEPLLPP